MKAVLISFVMLLGASTGAHASGAVAPAEGGGKATAVLAGGCFWCLEHDFQKLPGVIEAVSGYAGGTRASPTYQDYNKTDATNTVPHIEVVQVTWNTSKLSYGQILDYYFRHVDPTDGGGQFCDRGPGYRPAIFAATPEEMKLAMAKATEVEGLIKQKVAVEVLPGAPFWPAEDYHQDYADKNPTKYQFYRWNCGRDQRVQQIWAGAKSSE